MNCFRAFETDLEDLLLEPESAELLEFEAHCETCADCAAELAVHRGLLARLAGEPVKTEHPSDALLLRFRRDPDALSADERRGIHTHLAACMPCDSAYRATLSLVPEPQLSPLARLRAGLRGVLAPGGVPAWAASAAVLLLAVGVFFAVDPFGAPQDPGVHLLRGEEPAARQVELERDRRASLALYGDESVRLLFALPTTLEGRELEVEIAVEGEEPIFTGTVEHAEGESFVTLDGDVLERDTYLVKLASADGETVVYALDVR